jgi:hypothetical protein
LSDDEVSISAIEGEPPHLFNDVSLVEANEDNEEFKFDDHGSIYELTLPQYLHVNGGAISQ